MRTNHVPDDFASSARSRNTAPAVAHRFGDFSDPGVHPRTLSKRFRVKVTYNISSKICAMLICSAKFIPTLL
jgi:hypothetical protein